MSVEQLQLLILILLHHSDTGRLREQVADLVMSMTGRENQNLHRCVAKCSCQSCLSQNLHVPPAIRVLAVLRLIAEAVLDQCQNGLHAESGARKGPW